MQGIRMQFTKRTIKAAIVATLGIGVVLTLGVAIGMVKLWPLARTSIENAVGGANTETARRVIAQVGAWLGDERISQLSRTEAGSAVLDAFAANPELTQVLKWTTTTPALGPLVQNGGYQKALEEAVRQNVSDLTQIRLDAVASPEVRAMVAHVQQVVAQHPDGAEAVSTVNTNILNLLKSESFARLRENPAFARLLSEPAKERE
jgi:hypothetical protein